MGECRSGPEPLPGPSISQEEEEGGWDLDRGWVLWLCIPRLILGAGVHDGCCGDPTVLLGIPSGTQPSGTGPVPTPVAGPIILGLACPTPSAIHSLVLIHL